MNEQWASWVPSIIAALSAAIVIGGYFNTLKEHERRLDKHDALHDATEKHDALQDVALAKLESWQEGYKAARSDAQSELSKLGRTAQS